MCEQSVRAGIRIRMFRGRYRREVLTDQYIRPLRTSKLFLPQE